MTEPQPPLRTASLRRRVQLAVLGVFAVALVLTVVVVGVLYAVQSRRAVDAVLTSRGQLARQLAAQGVDPEVLIRRVDRSSVRAQVVLTDGTRYGGVPRGDDTGKRTVTLTGPGRLAGARLTMVPDTALLSGTTRTLEQVLVITGAVALLATSVVLALVVRAALRPLDAMAGLARRIAAGDRGRRLAPTRTDTELGRTAAAFDEMLGALEGAEAQARESELSTRRFVADAAHELRTPIAGMSSVAEAILAHDDLGPAQRERLRGLLHQQSRLAAKLVDDLLDLARLDVGVTLDLRPVAVRQVAEEAGERVRLARPALTVTVTGTDPVAGADPARLTQILAILLDNAAQATPDGGRIEMLTGEDGGWAVVEVTDTGRGVPPAEREHIFERLVRLDAARADRTDGSGLGLAIARGYARAHGGDLRCLPPRPTLATGPELAGTEVAGPEATGASAWEAADAPGPVGAGTARPTRREAVGPRDPGSATAGEDGAADPGPGGESPGARFRLTVPLAR